MSGGIKTTNPEVQHGKEVSFLEKIIYDVNQQPITWYTDKPLRAEGGNR